MNVSSRWWLSVALAIAGTGLAQAQQKDGSGGRVDPALVGHYYLNGVMETGSEMLLNADGRFQWMMVYGALDQTAQGRWHRIGDRVVLQSDPVAKTPEFRPFTDAEMQSHPPSSADAWTAVVGIPEQGPMSGVEVMFESDDGKTQTRITGADGMATLQPFPKGRNWTRAALRRQGRNEAWQWFALPEPWQSERFAAYFVKDASAYRKTAFEKMELRVDGRELVPSWPWEDGKERGRYARE
ncbi:hypothetical protein M2650_08080 [Luteimonas sp. SX5]|uniref:Uncharacterized protein n=1 Tax=Luteimonas galliterrae TaxID=2940486 RepID=A0ABT0MI96_9GAMM|nr:hypothetical protein [Luteimonas galliterrae]MCL1634586.1 hypothetical protein [Luteimonas galliterrae]